MLVTIISEDVDLDLVQSTVVNDNWLGLPIVDFGPAIRTNIIINPNWFGAQQVVPPNQLYTSRVVNVSLAGLPGTSIRLALYPHVLLNTNVFGPTTIARWGLAQTRVVNSSILRAPSLQRYGINPLRFSNVSVFYNPTVVPTRVLSPTRVNNVAHFGTQDVAIGTSGRDITQTRVVNSSTIGANVVTMTLATTQIVNSSIIGSQQVASDLRQQQVVNSSSFGSQHVAIIVAPSYANLGGTGNRQPMISAAISGAAGGGSVFNLLNGSYDNGYFLANGGGTPQTIMFDFRAIGPQRITEAKWYQTNSDTHGVWKWQGSNDNSSWTDVGTTFTLGGTSPQTQTTLSGNTNTYFYYRLFMVSGTTSWNPYITELEFKLVGGDEPANSVLSVLHPGGMGARGSLITVTGSVTAGAGSISNLVNGGWGTNSTDAFWFSGGASTGNIRFDFGAKRIIDEAYWGQDRTDTQGTWKWQGSNDGTTFTDIGSTFTFGGNFRNIFATLNGNVTPYRYYQLLHTATGTGALAWNVEITFRIDNDTHP